jgi:PAS domain S-box-containing protein
VESWRQPRTWIVTALAAALLVAAGVSFVRRTQAVEPRVGAGWADSSAGPIAVRVDRDSAAARAGLQEGDLLLEVEGRRVRTALEAAELAWAAGTGVAVELLVSRGSAPRTVHLEPEWEASDESYVYLAIVGLAFWISGLLIALRWPSVRGGSVYATLAACLAAHLTFSPTGRADLLDWAFSWGDIAAGALWPALLLHLGVALTKRTLRWRRTVLAAAYAATASLVAVAFWLSPAGLGGAYRWTSPLRVIEVWDRAGYLLMALAMLLTAAVLAKSHSNTSSAMHRSQMRWLLGGLCVGFGPFVMFYAVPWALGAAELPQWARFMAVLPMLLVPAAFTAALVQHRLHDLDWLVMRGFAEVTAVFFTFAVLSSTVFLLREGISEILPLSRSTSRYIGFLVAAISYPQLRRWVRAGAEWAFYRQRYSYRATLLDWARELNAETDLASLLRSLSSRVRDTLGLPEAEVLLRTGPRRFETVGSDGAGRAVEVDGTLLERLEQEPCVDVGEGALHGLVWARFLFSMKVKGKLRAVLAVSDREAANDPLSGEDRSLLRTLAAQAGTAIEAARLFQEVRRRADEIGRLHALQEKILETSAVGLLLVDGGGRVRAWNRAIEEIYGLSRDEALGRSLAEVFPLDVARRIERDGSRPEPSGEARIFRLNMTDRRGRRRLVNIAISPVDDAKAPGEGGLVVTLDDVTQRVQLEEQMLQQERLASLGLLAAGVAHEINTPLTGISSYTQLLLEQGKGEAGGELLQKIEAQTQRASSITRSLLTLARPEPTEFESLDLNEAIRGVLQLFEPQVRGCGITLETCLDESLPAVRGNRGKLQQVFLNILLNARDAVERDGEIAVVTRARKGRAIVEITDSGKGIAEEDLTRIFDPFFTTKGRGHGTGLGLSITYGIVQEHHGRIHAESEPGGRTLFRVELPAAGRARALA